MKKRVVALLLFCLLLTGMALPAAAADSDPAEQLRAMATEAIRSRQSELNVESLGLSSDTVKAVLSEVRMDPELYYYESYTLWKYESSGLATRLEFLYRDGFSSAETAAFEAAVAEALKCVLPGMSTLQAALALHDYLAAHVAYDEENYDNGTIPPVSRTAYGALVLGVAVCQGYAQAYRLLLGRCGIENAYVRSSDMNHGWAMVRVGKDWYHVDVTWDDPTPDTPGQVKHKYFMLSDAAISDEDHGHYNWETDHVCENDRYDTNVFWDDLNTVIPFTDADTYWFLHDQGDYNDQLICLLRRSWSTGEYKTVISVRDYWSVWGGSGSYWSKIYSGLVLLDERLFFNDKLHVYAYDPADDTTETVFTYTGGEGYLFGLTSDGTTLQYLLKQSPNQDDYLLYPVPLTLKYPPGPFTDVTRSDYYFDAVQWAYGQNVTTGTSATTFSPAATCTRGQVATFLWRAMGKPAPRTLVNPFADVPEDAYYRDAVLWAVEQGITNGTGADPETGLQRFSPDQECTYAHILTFLWRCQTGLGASSYGNWYSEALDWASAQGLLADTASGTRVEDNCPRCNVVTYLWRALA